MVKIAHIATADRTIRYFLLRQLCYLRDSGFEVTALSSAGINIKDIEQAGIRHIAVPLTRRITPIRDFFAFVRLCWVLRKEKFDILHTHTPKANLLGQLAARFVGIPIRVSTNHGLYYSPEFPFFKKLFFVLVEKVSAMFADTVFVVNKEDVHRMHQLRIMDKNKIRLLEGGIGINLETFSRETVSEEHTSELRKSLRIQQDDMVVGFVGRLVQEKGLLDLFEVAKRVRVSCPQVRFLIVGATDAEKHDAVNPSIAKEYGVDDICIFTGARKDTPALYTLMHVLFLPSHREGFGLVLAEAAAMGIPVVASDLGGCRQAVENLKNGYLLPSGDIKAFTEAIMKLLKDDELRLKMGIRGEQLARERFDDRKVNDFVLNEYRQVAARKGMHI